MFVHRTKPGPLAQSVASPTADPGVGNSILARSHTFMKIDHEIISLVILLLQLSHEGSVRVRNQKFNFLFFNQNMFCACSKEPSHWDGSFEHQKQMLKLMDKKIFTILVYQDVCI